MHVCSRTVPKLYQPLVNALRLFPGVDPTSNSVFIFSAEPVPFWVLFLTCWCLLQWLTHYGLVTQCGLLNLGKHWFEWWLVAWWHQAITWSNDDLYHKQYDPQLYLSMLFQGQFCCYHSFKVMAHVVVSIENGFPGGQWVNPAHSCWWTCPLLRLMTPGLTHWGPSDAYIVSVD